MLTDPTEIAIISQARQKNVRDPNRSRQHFTNIISDFDIYCDVSGQTVLDMGPGQFDLGVLLRERGADVVGIDNDPAVVALGNYKRFRVYEGDLTNIDGLGVNERFDGVFCKFSISALWFTTAESQRRHMRELTDLVTAGAWGWIAPWNGGHEGQSAAEVTRRLRAQIEAFAEAGFTAWELSPLATRRYGVHGHVANTVLFTRGLTVPDGRGLLRALTPEAPYGSGAPWPEDAASSVPPASRWRGWRRLFKAPTKDRR